LDWNLEDRELWKRWDGNLALPVRGSDKLKQKRYGN